MEASGSDSAVCFSVEPDSALFQAMKTACGVHTSRLTSYFCQLTWQLGLRSMDTLHSHFESLFK